MKNYKLYIIILFFIAAFTTACDENLEVAPTKELETEYFNSELRMQTGVLAVYAKLTDLYTYNNNNPMHKLWLLPGDDLRSNNPKTLDNFKGLTGGDSDISRAWDRLYQIVARANTMLQKIEENNEVYRTPSLKDYNTGEMLFLRGWSFYKLWSWYEKAPIILERVVGLENVYKGPSEGTEMLDQAITDLEMAAQLLPESWASTEAGKVTKDAAYGMLVKCFVTRANYSDNSAEYYNEAISAFGNISSAKQLVDQFGKNFDYRYENNSESLFEFQASLKTAENPWLDNDFGTSVGSMGAFYKHFLNDWTNQGTIVGPTIKLINAFDAADPRVPETFEATTNVQWTFNGGYKMLKYVNNDRNKFGGIANINSINNTRLLRLADVKLLAAEAFLQTGQDGKALDQVNDIRERARFSTPSGTEAAAPLNLVSLNMQDIMDERLKELTGEDGIRWNDLRRWDAAGFINLNNWTKVDFGFAPSYDDGLWGFEAPKNLLMPIPIAEMDNNPKMLESGQNPGY